jgi:broad specificity phosphatase PhoE
MAHTVWIARHGNRQDFVDPDWPKTAERPYDPGLSPDGIVQACQLAERMESEHISAIFASPFLRAVETAHQIAELLDLPIFIEPGMSEWFNPEWFPDAPQTMPRDLLVERFPRVDLTYSSKIRPRYPETEDNAMRRSAEAAHAIAESFPEPVLLVGHGVSVAGATVGLDPDAVIRECGLCCLFKIVRQSDKWQMKLCGDVSHLDEVGAENRFN